MTAGTTAAARIAAGTGDHHHERRSLRADVAPSVVTTRAVTATPNAARRKRGAVLKTAAVASATATAVISTVAAADHAPRLTHKTTNGPATRNRNSRPQPVDSRMVAWNSSPWRNARRSTMPKNNKPQKMA